MPIKEKRTLIITDEFFLLPKCNKFHMFLPLAQHPPLILLLHFLLKEGFALYGHTHAGLKKIENESQLSNILPLVVAASEKTVLEMALMSRGLYQDKVKVLNAATLRYLLIMLKKHLKINNDEKANPAERPGFFIIGSKNPLSYEGRRPLSKALTNRFCIITLHEYIEEELICIGMANKMAQAALCAKGFFFEKEQARINGKEIFTLRDFLSNEGLWTQIGQRLLDETPSSSSEEELIVIEEKQSSGEKRKREHQAIQDKESNNKKTKKIVSSFLSTSERIPSSTSTPLSSTPTLTPLRQ